MIILPDWLQVALATKPEYGMGYQRIRAKLSSGGTETGIVLNAQIFVKEADRSAQALLSEWNSLLAEARKSSLKIESADLIPRPPETLRGIRRIAVANAKKSVLIESFGSTTKSAEIPARDAPVTSTAVGEIFKRFSAYSNDRRVTAKSGLTSGTFATTKEDADQNVKTGSDAVSRYALENKSPASNVFTITPPKDLDLQRGTVEPAYGEKGGGVEVIFVNGSPDGTVTGPVVIPDK
jgi:hypothetical protein